MPYNYDQVMQALRNADAAGDADGARRLAQIAAGMKKAPEPEGDFMKSMKEFGGAAKEALGALPLFGMKPPENEGLKGPIEAVAHGVTGAAGFMAGLPLGAVAKAKDPSQSYPEHVSRIADNLTYEPKTKLGEDLSKPIDEAFYRAQALVGHGVPDLPRGAHPPASGPIDTTPPVARTGQAADMGMRTKPKGLDVEGFAAAQNGVVDSPSLTTRRKGAQGELFPDTSITEKIGKKDNTVVPGAASQFDPFQEQSPYVARRGTNGQMELPMGERGRSELNRLDESDPIARAESVQRDEPHLPSVIRQTPQGQGQLLPADAGTAAAINRTSPPMERPFPLGPVEGRQLRLPLEELNLEHNGEMAPRGPRDPMVSGPQQELFSPQMDLAHNGDMAPLAPKEPFRGQQGDMFGPLLDLEHSGEIAPGERTLKSASEEAAGHAEMVKAQKELEAQRAFNARQMQLDFEVKKQTGLDMNAAERARQERAPVPGIENEHVNAFKDFQQKLEEVQSHPEVQLAQERARKAEEFYTRVADGMQNGLQQMNVRLLKRLEVDVAHFQEAAAETAKTIVLEQSNPLKNRPISSVGSISRQRGGQIMLNDAVQKAVDLLKKVAGELGPVKTMLEHFMNSGDPQVISTTRKVMKSEGADPKILDALDQTLIAAHKQKLDDFARSMAPRRSSPGGKQSGYILLESKKRKALTNLATKIGIDEKLGEIAPSQWTPEEAVRQAKLGSDLDQNVVQRILNNFTKGGLYMALKTHNPLIRYVVEKIQEADRLSRAMTRDWVHGRLAPAMREMSAAEQGQIWKAIEVADLSQRPIDFDALARSGANPAQIQFAKEHREAMDFAYTQINRARAAAGKEPIDKRVAYAAMRASGDFRRLVYDKEGGKVVGIIGSDFRRRLEGLQGEMEKQGFHVGEERYFGAHVKNRDSANEAFMSAIEHMADSDPRVADFVDVLDKIRTSEAYNFLNTKKHTMDKKGIQGMDGRKSWMSPEENAADGFRSQLNYMEAAIKWGNLSEAADAIKPLMTDKEVKMPLAKRWAEDYLKNALGFNPSEVGSSLENSLSAAFKSTGMGYSVMRGAMADARKMTNGLLLMLNPRFWATNIVQPMQAMPGMKAMMIARGLDAGFDFGTGYSYLAEATNTMMKKNTGIAHDAFEKAAIKYASDHHVYGSDMVEHSNAIRKGAGFYAEKTSNFMAGKIESMTRQMAFYAFAHMLRENGMSEKNGIFTAAHNLTDLMMNNYSAVDRPSIYNSLGPVGDLAVNLQSYKHNELSRISLFARHAQEYHSVRPLIAHLTAGLAFGGILGTIAYDEADQAYSLITRLMGKPDSLTNHVFSLSKGIGKQMNDRFGIDQPYLASHGVFSMAGADMTRSLGLTDIVPNNPADILFPGSSKLGETAAAAYHVTGLPGSGDGAGPTEMNFKRLARAASPIGMQGAVDRKFFEQPNGLAVRPRDLTGQAYRNETDKNLKNFGFTGVNESVQRQMTYNIEKEYRGYSDIRTDALGAMRDQLYAKQPIDSKSIDKYLQAKGSVKTLNTDLEKYAKSQNMSAYELNTLRAAASRSIAQREKAAEYVRMFSK